MANQFNDLIKHINNSVDVQYKWAVRERKDIYFDRWEYIIRDAIEDQFSPDSYERLRCLITGELNIFKRAVNAISMIYKGSAERKAVISEDEDTLITDETYNEIIKEIPYDLIMRKVNQLTNATNATVVRTVYREGKLDYDILNFDNVEIITDPNDWKKIIAYKFHIGSTLPFMQKEREITNGKILADPHRTHPQEQAPFTKFDQAILYTSDSEFFEPEFRGKIIHFEQTRGGDARIMTSSEGFQQVDENPYKDENGATVLPFTLITKDYPVDNLIDYSTGNDLVYLTITTALNYVHMNNLIKHQSWKQGYIISDKELPKNFTLSPEQWLNIPASKNGGSTEVGLLDMQADLKTQWEVIRERVATGLAQYGIDAESFLRKGGNAESGFALEIRKEGLQEIRDEQLPLYRKGEKDIFEVSRIVHNWHRPEKKINEKAEFRIDYADMRPTVNQAEEDNHWLLLIREDIESKLDWVKQNNPDIKTDAQAEEVLRTNKEINKRLTGVLTPTPQPTQAPGPEVENNEPQPV